MIKRITAMVLALMSALILSGCSTAEKSSGDVVSVAFVIGGHGCSRELNLSSHQVRNLTTNAVESEGFVSVINADGEPDIVAELSFELDDRYRNADPIRLKQDAQNKTSALLYELTQVRADSPEIDTLAAISLAARTLGDAPADSQKYILVLDTGLSTTGLLSFGNNLLGASPSVIADMLEELEAIPDMQGMRILWQHLGDTAAPQGELTARQRNCLESIWRSILERGGAEVEFSTAIPNTGAATGLPNVTVLDLPKDVPIAFEPASTVIDFQEPVFLRDNLIQFVGDSAEFLDREKAAAVLKPIADYMISHGDISLLLVGTTAGDNDSAYTLELSLSRANTVRSALVDMGVAAERLTAKGMGCSDPWHIQNIGVEGPLASQNRKVVLIDADSDAARSLTG